MQQTYYSYPSPINGIQSVDCRTGIYVVKPLYVCLLAAVIPCHLYGLPAHWYRLRARSTWFKRLSYISIVAVTYSDTATAPDDVLNSALLTLFFSSLLLFFAYQPNSTFGLYFDYRLHFYFNYIP